MAWGPDSGSAPASHDLAIPQFMEIQIKAVFYTAPGFMRWSARRASILFLCVRRKDGEVVWNRKRRQPPGDLN